MQWLSVTFECYTTEKLIFIEHIGQVTKGGLSWYLVLLSFDSKTRCKASPPSWPDLYASHWPVRHQAISWTHADLLSTGWLATNVSEILIKLQLSLLKNEMLWKCCQQLGPLFKQQHFKLNQYHNFPWISSIYIISISKQELKVYFPKYWCVSSQGHLNGSTTVTLQYLEIEMMHICVSKLTSIGSDNGLSPGWRQAIIWTNAGTLLIGPLWANFSEILIKILTFSFKKMHFEVSSAKWRPFCVGLNGLMLNGPLICLLQPCGFIMNAAMRFIDNNVPSPAE